MKIVKKLLSFIVAVIMIVSLFPTSALAGGGDDDGTLLNFRPFSEGLAVIGRRAKVSEPMKYGYIDTAGKSIISCKYDSASDFSGGLAMVRQGDRYLYINKKGEVVINYSYDASLGFINDKKYKFGEGLGIVPIKKNNLYGYIDNKGRQIIPPIYEGIEAFNENGIAVVRKNRLYGCVDVTGKVIVEPVYKNPFKFSEGYAFVYNGTNHGYIDESGKVVLDFAYNLNQNTPEFSEGLACVYGSKKGEPHVDYRYIDKDGNTVIDASDYNEPHKFSEGLAWVKDQKNKTQKFGAINKKGQVVIDFKYDRAYDFENGIALVQIKNKYGYVNTKGVLIADTIYDSVDDFTHSSYHAKFAQGFSRVVKDKLAGYIDKSGRYYEYEKIGEFSDELAAVQSRQAADYTHTYGYIDRSGKRVIGMNFVTANNFSEGLALVAKKDNNKRYIFGYIDKNGKVAVEFKYSFPSGNGSENFKDGLAKVVLPGDAYGSGSSSFYINKQGKKVVHLEYAEDTGFSEGYLINWDRLKAVYRIIKHPLI